MAKPDVQSSPAFVDTNVLVYAFDTANPEKHVAANTLTTQLVGEGRLCLSVQVLHEFYSVVTRPSRPFRLTHEQALKIVSEFVEMSTVVSLTPSITLSALQVVGQHNISFWDALIWAAAQQSGCSAVYSEDFQHGRELGGITFVNPFLKP